MTVRIGIGYDVHAFAPVDAHRPLMIGGIAIAHPCGLAGHSDADVLLHAVVDALLGAAGLGDIGQHFPSSDPRWLGASSAAFVDHVISLLEASGWRVGNLDATVVAEQPRLTPHVPAIRAHIAQSLRIEQEQVNIKSKTTDGLGFTGRREGIACYAIVLLER